jgi:hypothetical protein
MTLSSAFDQSQPRSSGARKSAGYAQALAGRLLGRYLTSLPSPITQLVDARVDARVAAALSEARADRSAEIQHLNAQWQELNHLVRNVAERMQACELELAESNDIVRRASALVTDQVALARRLASIEEGLLRVDNGGVHPPME